MADRWPARPLNPVDPTAGGLRQRQLSMSDPPERAPRPHKTVHRPPRVPTGVCRFCGRSTYRSLGTSCGRRACPGYIELWLGDVRARIFENLIAYRGQVVMTTVTAPALPWDTFRCTHAPGVKCSGTHGCRVDADVAWEWNRTADGRMSALHRSAQQVVRRKHGPGVLRRLVLAPEPQRRGVIHWHVVLGCATAAERAAATTYVHAMHSLARRHGYGFVDRKLRPSHAVQAANYVSKYLTKGSEAANGLRTLVVEGQAPARAVHVDRRLTVETRCTMRVLRLRRLVYCVMGVRLSCPEAETVGTLLLTFRAARWEDPPPSGAPPG